MSEDNVMELLPLRSSGRGSVVEAEAQKAPQTFEEKFESLVKLLSEHGIHLR